MNVSEKNKKIIFLLLCCFYFYSVIFKEIRLLGYIFYYILPIVFCLFHIESLKKMFETIGSSSLKYYFIAFGTLAIMSLFLPILHGTFDFTYFSIRILQGIKELIKLTFLTVFFIKYISPEYDYILFMKYFILSTCIYVGFTCLTILFPAIRELIIDHLILDENNIRLLNKSNYFTRFGWCGFSGFTFTLKASLSVIFSIYLIFIDDGEHFVENIIYLLISFLGNLFYGRIGLVCSGISILIGLIYLYKNNKQSAKKLFIILTCFAVIVIISALFIKKIQVWFLWAFQSIFNFIESGSFSTTSTEALSNMYVFPGFKTLILGDGMYSTSTGYYMNIDVGLLRPIYFGGIIFQMFRYFLVFILLKNINLSQKKCDRIFVIMLSIFFIMFEMKGEIIFPIISILFVVVFLMNVSKKEVNYD